MILFHKAFGLWLIGSRQVPAHAQTLAEIHRTLEVTGSSIRGQVIRHAELTDPASVKSY
jgi:hypothetical protein